jgi:Fibronectin type III domain
VKGFLWVIGSILALDVLLVAVFAVSAAVVRRRAPHPVADPGPWWSVEGRGRVRALSAVPSPSDDDDAPIPIRRDRVRLVSDPAPPETTGGHRLGGHRLGGHRVAAIGVVAAMIFASTAVASPQVRRLVATAIGAVSDGLGSETADPSEQAAAGSGGGEPTAPDTVAPRAPASDGPPSERSGAAPTPAPAVDPRPTGSPHQGVFPPLAPTGVMAVAAGSGAIVVTWADVTGATAYRVERSPDGSVGWQMEASHIDQGVGTVTDGSLQPGTTYFYRVVSVAGDLESVPSNTVSATTAVDVPASPVVEIAASTSDRVDLAWGDVTGEIGYVIERSTDAGATWTTIGTTGQDVTVASDTGLEAGTSYWYRIVAWNAAGSSPASDVVSATTDQGSAPGDTGAGTDPVPTARVSTHTDPGHTHLGTTP